MKKSLILLAIISSFLLSSCSEEADYSSATVYIGLDIPKELNKFYEGTPVYMFREDKKPNSEFFKPEFADKTSGISDRSAVFELKHPDVKLREQTTLYFAVFKGNECLGFSAVTVKNNDKIYHNIVILRPENN